MEPPTLDGWNDHVKTLGSISLRNSCALLNPHTIHTLFGSASNNQMYRAYVVKNMETVGEKVKFKLNGSYHVELAQAFATVQELETQQCWYYIPDKQYIIYIEGHDMLCVDYGHFDEAQTLVVEFLKLPRDPLHNFADLQLMINNCHEFVQVVQERQRLLAPRSNQDSGDSEAERFDISRRCQYCRKVCDKTLLACSRCRAAYYCNRSCQGRHLPTHKLDCIEVKVAAICTENDV